VVRCGSSAADQAQVAARLRREVEPVEQRTLARFMTHWQGLIAPRRGPNLDALLDAIESLQGAPLPATLVETAILPARIADFTPAGLDTLIAAARWRGRAWSRSANATGASRFSCRQTAAAGATEAAQGTADRREEKLLGILESTGQVSSIHCIKPREALSGRDDRRALEPGVARVDHQRLAARAARLHCRPDSARAREGCKRERCSGRGALRRQRRRALVHFADWFANWR